MLVILKQIEINRWNIIPLIVSCIKEKSVEIIRKGWSDKFRQERPDFYPLDLSEISTWSTYDHCVFAAFSIQDKRLYCSVAIYEGSSWSGERRDLRFTAEMILPDEFILKIAEVVEARFDNRLQEEYERHLESQAERWKKNYKKQLLLKPATKRKKS